jgi:hypothetical protein
VSKNSDYEYFKKNFNMLLDKYSGKFVVIKNCAIIGVYDTFNEAYVKTTEKEELGSFIIQHCINEEESMLGFESNNVVFA